MDKNKFIGMGIFSIGPIILTTMYTSAIVYKAKHPHRLESDSIDTSMYGEHFFQADRDNNAQYESYFTDPATGKLHRVRINSATGELTYTLVK